MSTLANSAPAAALIANPPAAGAEDPVRTLVDELLEEQHRLSAVERFSQQHQQLSEPRQARYYRDLIPIQPPGKDEQYAFEVDLDACTACKACVGACHSLNGLDDGESWRDVGTLVGGDNGSTVQHTVTTACHHCADPACANGCPTLAYEKDLDTGIVRHLDDQCMGCRYCELKCPYEVPKYNDRLGIVRKCDMCHGRLSEGEAPACVQACPNQAIRIRVVRRDAIDQRSTPADRLLPGVIASDYTRPSTVFTNLASVDLRAADEGRVTPAHGHTPLVWMLALTQIGAGLVAGEWLLRVFGQTPRSPWILALAIALSIAGLAASVLHLGRPLQAWRAFLGWRRSWLSREILVFGAWGGVMTAFGVSAILAPPAWVTLGVGAAATALGVAGIFCSVMVYADTRRRLWRQPMTALRFFGSFASAALVLGPLSWLAAVVRLAMVAVDLRTWWGSGDEPELSVRRLRGPLRRIARWRLGVDLVAVALLFVGGMWVWPALVLMIAADVAVRRLFFQAVDEPGMPGALVA